MVPGGEGLDNDEDDNYYQCLGLSGSAQRGGLKERRSPTSVSTLLCGHNAVFSQGLIQGGQHRCDSLLLKTHKFLSSRREFSWTQNLMCFDHKTDLLSARQPKSLFQTFFLRDWKNSNLVCSLLCIWMVNKLFRGGRGVHNEGNVQRHVHNSIRPPHLTAALGPKE